MSYLGRGLPLSSSGATSEADQQATLVGCHEYVSVVLTNKNRSEARKGNWNFLKKKIERQEKETAQPRFCDVISPDHFVRGFYNSSFRRCRPNFLVLQKEYKILVHYLSIYEKLEQSTHWIIQKKWGKDFTFGSDCTVSQLLAFTVSPLKMEMEDNVGEERKTTIQQRTCSATVSGSGKRKTNSVT